MGRKQKKNYYKQALHFTTNNPKRRKIILLKTSLALSK
jgi:hypothetical protein